MEKDLRVYLHGSPGRTPEASHTMYVAPAAYNPNQEAVPSHWVDFENKPVTFEVSFEYGAGEVEDALGKYMIEIGMAKPSRLIIPGYWGSAV